jgi:hypothetical protein
MREDEPEIIDVPDEFIQRRIDELTEKATDALTGLIRAAGHLHYLHASGAGGDTVAWLHIRGYARGLRNIGVALEAIAAEQTRIDR